PTLQPRALWFRRSPQNLAEPRGELQWWHLERLHRERFEPARWAGGLVRWLLGRRRRVRAGDQAEHQQAEKRPRAKNQAQPSNRPPHADADPGRNQLSPAPQALARRGIEGAAGLGHPLVSAHRSP